jgi:predicted alpha/beta-hydrolase family hydrolase
VTARLRLDEATQVAAALHLPSGAGAVAPAVPARSHAPVLLLPGARGDHAAEHLVALAEVLAEAGHPVIRSAFTRRPPGIGAAGRTEQAVAKVPALLAAARALMADSGASAAARADWIIGGASFGGRVASLAVAASGGAALGVCGVLALAYPLHPPGRPGELRIEHWPRIDVPMLLISGDADEFAIDGGIERHIGSIAGGGRLELVPGAAHDLSVTARRDPAGRRRSPSEAVRSRAEVLLAWAASVPG